MSKNKRQKKKLRDLKNLSKYSVNIVKIKELAIKYNWVYISQSYDGKAVVFKKDGVVININPLLLTVTTQMNHPNSGNTQLVRKNMNMNMIEKIFKNPRIHTGHGVVYKQGK